MTELVLTC